MLLEHVLYGNLSSGFVSSQCLYSATTLWVEAFPSKLYPSNVCYCPHHSRLPCVWSSKTSSWPSSHTPRRWAIQKMVSYSLDPQIMLRMLYCFNMHRLYQDAEHSTKHCICGSTNTPSPQPWPLHHSDWGVLAKKQHATLRERVCWNLFLCQLM